MSEYTPTTKDVREVWIEAQDITHDEGDDFHGAEFDRWLAAHDADVRAGVVTEEPEWEYGTRCPIRECTEPHLLDESDSPPQPEESLWRRTRERHVPPGEWVPVKQEGAETDA